MSADPGCGKSVLARHLIDSVLPSSTKGRAVCYFFFKDDYEDQRRADIALCCILHQLFQQNRGLLSDAILNQFDTGGAAFTNSFPKLWRIFISAATEESAGEIICLLDAIDECEEGGRFHLAQELCNLYRTERDMKLKFLTTSRPYGSIRQGFQELKFPESPMIHLSGEDEEEVEKISREIDAFIKARVQNIGISTRTGASPGEAYAGPQPDIPMGIPNSGLHREGNLRRQSCNNQRNFQPSQNH